MNAARGREDPRADGHRPRVPDSAGARLHERRPAAGRSTPTCTGTADDNNIWGDGIVDALAAVTDRNG